MTPVVAPRYNKNDSVRVKYALPNVGLAEGTICLVLASFSVTTTLTNDPGALGEAVINLACCEIAYLSSGKREDGSKFLNLRSAYVPEVFLEPSKTQCPISMAFREYPNSWLFRVDRRAVPEGFVGNLGIGFVREAGMRATVTLIG